MEFFKKTSDSEMPLSAASVFGIVPEAELLQPPLKAGRTAENYKQCLMHGLLSVKGHRKSNPTF